MSNSAHFDSLVKKGNPIGEVIAVDKFLIKVRGLQPCTINTLVMFEDGSKGFVHEIMPEYISVLHLGSVPVKSGMVAVVQHKELVTKVGKEFIGRVVSVTGEPLDGKGPIVAEDVWPVFKDAPPIHERRLIQDQVESGVVAIDALFPVVRGQRMAMIGDSKTGKSTLATQLTINQKNTDQLVVYCLIAKRRADVDTLLDHLKTNGSLEKVVVVVATIFESLIVNYIAPYVACSIAEFFWQKMQVDTIVIYDDLTSHAHTYREISLLSNVSPGRDSYPGDMFYAHSSLLERAGRLNSSGKTLTSIPIVHAANGDITAYLPTNIMSITDGQWIMDMQTFRKGIRPALNIGLSVTRAGGLGHNARQKEYAAKTMKVLADYREAEEYSHFGSELGTEARKAYQTGKQIFEVLTQGPNDSYSLMSQQLMFDILLNLADNEKLDVGKLKQSANEYAGRIKKDEDFMAVRDELKKLCVTMPKTSQTEAAAAQLDDQQDAPEQTKQAQPTAAPDAKEKEKQEVHP
ncbi:MAG TPA: hypothetical protein VL989_01065 [Candidatus Sulfotelmatobacter sp.]|nr:hypothetical protein [Candidatus Sulfotelmatobacter sp.]